MAEVTQVKLSDNTVYDIVDSKKKGIYVVKGTQSASTGAWTGNIDVDALYDGLTILYYLPYAGSGNATLNLTLNNGQTTGAKNCYYNTGRLTTHFGAGTNFVMTYWSAGSISVAGTATTDDRWIITAQYDTNNYDRLRYQQNIKCGSTAIVAGNIIVGRDNYTYTHLKLGGAFRLDMPILYAGSAIAVNKTGTNNYVAYPFAIATTQSITFTAYAPVYLKGTMDGNTFTPDSTAAITQTIPTTEDNKHYLLLGTAYSTSALYLLPDHTVFAYKGGKFGPIVNAAIQSGGGGGSAGVTIYKKDQSTSVTFSGSFKTLITSPSIPAETEPHLYQVQVASNGFRGTADAGYTVLRISGLGDSTPNPLVWTGSAEVTTSSGQTSYSANTWAPPVYLIGSAGGVVTAEIRCSVNPSSGFFMGVATDTKIRVVDLGPVTEVT